MCVAIGGEEQEKTGGKTRRARQVVKFKAPRGTARKNKETISRFREMPEEL